MIRKISFIILLTYSTGYAQGHGSTNVTLLAHINNYSTIGYNDCWGYTAPDGREYALLGTRNGTSIIDITDTDNTVEIAFISSLTSTWKDIKTYRHYAYVVNESGGGIQIIDLSDLPNSATLAGTYDALSASHNIFIDEENAILYAEAFSSEPVWVMSLADPLNPVKLSDFGVECHDIFARDNIAYISEGNNSSIGIYDLTNPNSPTFIQRLPIPTSGYAHNAWLTDNSKYLLTTEEVPANMTVKMWNIQDMENISMTDEYIAEISSRPHNVFVKGNYAYVSHYTHGLRVVDISDPSNILEFGFYDTFTGNSNEFGGAWGTYPFFTSGKILISDQSTGLYVVYFEGAKNTPPVVFDIPEIKFEQNGSFTFDLDNHVRDHESDTSEITWSYTFPESNFSHTKTSKNDSIFISIDSLHQATITSAQDYITPPNGVPVVFIATDSTEFSGNDTTMIVISMPTSIIQNDNIPKTFTLNQNYPNPFNPETTIRYGLPGDSHIQIIIYDLLGKKIVTLEDGLKSAGYHHTTWNGRDTNGAHVSSGIYLYQIAIQTQNGYFIQTKRMVLLK